MTAIISGALTTLYDVKETMGIASDDHSWDNIIIRKINQVTKQIEAYCGRRFLLATYTDEDHGGNFIDQVVLKNRPIVGDVTFGIRDNSLNVDDFETIESSLFFVDTNSGVLNLLFRAAGHWDRYRVTYSAGYATIPEDLAEAAATLVAYYVLNSDGSRLGVNEIQEGQRRQKFGTNNHLLSFRNITEQLGIDAIIDNYANYPMMTDA